jgi:hypothetical protein
MVNGQILLIKRLDFKINFKKKIEFQSVGRKRIFIEIKTTEEPVTTQEKIFSFVWILWITFFILEIFYDNIYGEDGQQPMGI